MADVAASRQGMHRLFRRLAHNDSEEEDSDDDCMPSPSQARRMHFTGELALDVPDSPAVPCAKPNAAARASSAGHRSAYNQYMSQFSSRPKSAATISLVGAVVGAIKEAVEPQPAEQSPGSVSSPGSVPSPRSALLASAALLRSKVGSIDGVTATADVVANEAQWQTKLPRSDVTCGRTRTRVTGFPAGRRVLVAPTAQAKASQAMAEATSKAKRPKPDAVKMPGLLAALLADDDVVMPADKPMDKRADIATARPPVQPRPPQPIKRTRQGPRGSASARHTGDPKPRKVPLQQTAANSARPSSKERPMACEHLAKARVDVRAASKPGRPSLRSVVNTVSLMNGLGKGRIDTGRKGEELGQRMLLQRLAEVWATVDADNSGTLDTSEVKSVLQLMGQELSSREFMRAMDQMDGDGSGEVDFEEFSKWWAKKATSQGVVAPSTFTFNKVCVRAVLKQEQGGQGEHHWIADDIACVLYSSASPGSMDGVENQAAVEAEQTKMLQDLWSAFDTDRSGTLEQDEVAKVITAAFGRKVKDEELKKAFTEMDADGSGEIDFDEFVGWWRQQGDEVRERVQRRAFEQTMKTLSKDEVSQVIVDTANGPQQVRLVSPRGLFRLMMRSKSTGVRTFYEWVEKLVQDTRNDRQSRRRAVFSLPEVDDLVKDFTLRNLLIPIVNKDEWRLHKKHTLPRCLRNGNAPDVCVLTMESPLPHKANLLCVKGYVTIPFPIDEVDARLWDMSNRHKWDALSTEIKIIERDVDSDAVMSLSLYHFPYPFLPSPIPACELTMAHTRRVDADGTIVHASSSGNYSRKLPAGAKNGWPKKREVGEVFTSGLILAPMKKGAATKLTYVCVMQGGNGPPVPVVSQREYNDWHVVNTMERIYAHLCEQ